MEPWSTITTLRTNHEATPNPHSHDPCAWPSHQGSSYTTPPDLPFSYTSRCPLPGARHLRAHSWEFGIGLSLECLPEPLPLPARVPPPVDLHSLPFRYSRLRA